MKLCRVGEANKEKPAVIDKDGNYRDLTSIIKDLDPSTLNFETIDKLRNINVETLNIIDQKKRIGACISKPSKFLGIGLNYKDHALEQNLPVPKEPIIFSKFTNCISGPQDDIVIPKNSFHTDWEVELGFVIGKKAKYVSENEAMDYVLVFFLLMMLVKGNFRKTKV